MNKAKGEEEKGRRKGGEGELGPHWIRTVWTEKYIIADAGICNVDAACCAMAHAMEIPSSVRRVHTSITKE